METLNTVDLIIKKKQGKKLTEEELTFLVMGFTRGDIPDYQMSAFLMAVCLQGFDEEETVAFTQIMKRSGDMADLSAIKGCKVDKHSTGGVGDKTSLILSPIVAACGVPVAKMSGRGLGFTGGTIDKLESIPGFRTAIEDQVFYKLVNEKGLSIIGQTARIAPADKKIYALRDVTGTVDNLSLITSSIMSKKLASGADGILLDVKCGKGAFMKTKEEAVALARMMVKIGRADGKVMRALITDMNQPLGRAVGNALEVREAIDVLKGKGPDDITEISVCLAGHMIHMGKKAGSAEEGMTMAWDTLKSGKALEKFQEFVTGQGGDPQLVHHDELLPSCHIARDVTTETAGYLTHLDAMIIGHASCMTGAGRQTKEDTIEHGAGILLHKKIGDRVDAGEALCTVYGDDDNKVSLAARTAKEAFSIDADRTKAPELIHAVIE